MDFNILSEIETGDTLFFSNNAFVGTFLKITTLSKWHHVGVAVKIKDGNLSEKEGDLYVLEITPNKRINELSGRKINGVSLININTSLIKYNIIKYRKITKTSKDILKFTKDFALKYENISFNKSFKKTVYTWLGINNTIEGDFCSNLVYKYYMEYYDKEEFGLKRNYYNIRPCDFNEYSFDIYKDKSKNLYNYHPNIFSVIMQPLVILLTIYIIIMMIFIKKF